MVELKVVKDTEEKKEEQADTSIVVSEDLSTFTHNHREFTFRVVVDNGGREATLLYTTEFAVQFPDFLLAIMKEIPTQTATFISLRVVRRWWHSLLGVTIEDLIVKEKPILYAMAVRKIRQVEKECEIQRKFSKSK